MRILKLLSLRQKSKKASLTPDPSPGGRGEKIVSRNSDTIEESQEWGCPLSLRERAGVREGFAFRFTLNCCRILLSAISLLASATHACEPRLDGPKSANGKMAESASYKMVFRTQPEKVEIGKHFAVELAYCIKDGAGAVDSVRVDAHMPEHRHGMNYKTVVTSTGPRGYRAEGLMFHMPGRWEYIFELRAQGATERLTTSMVLQ